MLPGLRENRPGNELILMGGVFKGSCRQHGALLDGAVFPQTVSDGRKRGRAATLATAADQMSVAPWRIATCPIRLSIRS